MYILRVASIISSIVGSRPGDMLSMRSLEKNRHLRVLAKYPKGPFRQAKYLLTLKSREELRPRSPKNQASRGPVSSSDSLYFLITSGML